jgi:hypothetical protein
MTTHTPQRPHIELDFFTDEEMADIYKAVQDTFDKGRADADDRWHYFKKNTNNGFNVIFLDCHKQSKINFALS